MDSSVIWYQRKIVIRKRNPFKWLYSLVVEAGVEGSLSIFNHLSVTRSACIWVSMQVHLFDPVLFSCLFFLTCQSGLLHTSFMVPDTFNIEQVAYVCTYCLYILSTEHRKCKSRLENIHSERSFQPFSHLHAHCTYIKGTTDISGDITRNIAALKRKHPMHLLLVFYGTSILVLVHSIYNVYHPGSLTADMLIVLLVDTAPHLFSSNKQLQRKTGHKFLILSEADPLLACLYFGDRFGVMYPCVVFVYGILQRSLDNSSVPTIVKFGFQCDGPFYICYSGLQC